MIELATLLIRQRARRLQRQYGWITSLSLAFLLVLILWKMASIAARLVSLGSAVTLGQAFAWIWTTWIVMGVTTGRDLTWHLRLDRLFVFRVSLSRLYLLDVVLGLVSYPIAVMTAAIAFYGFRGGWSFRHWTFSAIAFVAFVIITRASVSIGRTVFYRGRAFSRLVRISLLVIVLTAAALMIMPAAFLGSPFNPGRMLGSVFSSTSYAAATGKLVVFSLVLTLLDYAIQRHVLRSGMIRPAPAGAVFGRLHRWFLLAGPERPSILWRVALLGWLRNRNALLLFIWGTSYGFLYTLLTHASGLGYFLSFIWMVLIFHSYLRGNLFGIDQKGVWFYFLLPVALRYVLRAKSSSMTLLQGVMVAAVLLPALLHRTVGMTAAVSWVCVLGFAASALLVGDIAGQLFSVLHPDPIERGSLYAGGMTAGAFAIPGIHVALVVLYVSVSELLRRGLPEAAAWSFFIGVPAFLAIVRWRALPIWIDQLLTRDREEILMQLSAVTP